MRRPTTTRRVARSTRREGGRAIATIPPHYLLAGIAILFLGVPLAISALLSLVERRWAPVLHPLRRLTAHARAGGGEQLLVPAPIRAHKVAHLLLRPEDGKVEFLGVAAPRRYGNPARARCQHERFRHAAPSHWCTCGLYAAKGRAGALRVSRETRWPVAMLRVELTGRVLEFRRAYRAQRQRVAAIEVPAGCVDCGDEARLLAGPVVDAVIRRRRRRNQTERMWSGSDRSLHPRLAAAHGWAVLAPRCARCADQPGYGWTTAGEVEGQLGTRVEWTATAA